MDWFPAHETFKEFATLYFVFWAFSAVVHGMPEPKEDASLGYRWAFNSLHFLAANLGKIRGGLKKE